MTSSRTLTFRGLPLRNWLTAFLNVFVGLVLAGSVSYYVGKWVMSPPDPLHGDLNSFVVSGQLLIRGANPYVAVPENWLADLGKHIVNLNPPLSLPFCVLLASARPDVLPAVWFSTSLMLYLISLVVLFRAYSDRTDLLRWMWAFALTGFWFSLALYQIYTFLLFLVVVSWVFLRRRAYARAGVCLGLLVAIKPTFVVWPVLLLISGAVMPAIVGLATFAALSVLPVLLYGPSIYGQWLEATQLYSIPGYYWNSAIPGIVTRMGNAWVGYIIGAGLIAFGLAFAWRVKLDAPRATELAIAISLLAGPLTWPGYTLLLLPAFLSRKEWAFGLKLSAAFLIVPFGLLFSGLLEALASFLWVIVLIREHADRKSFLLGTSAPAHSASKLNTF